MPGLLGLHPPRLLPGAGCVLARMPGRLALLGAFLPVACCWGLRSIAAVLLPFWVPCGRGPRSSRRRLGWPSRGSSGRRRPLLLCSLNTMCWRVLAAALLVGADHYRCSVSGQVVRFRPGQFAITDKRDLFPPHVSTTRRISRQDQEHEPVCFVIFSEVSQKSERRCPGTSSLREQHANLL